MKVIIKNGVYQKVTNEVADSEVSFNRAKYAPKSEWKKNVRDIAVASIEAKVADVKGNVTKSRRADNASKIKAKQRPSEYTDKFLR